MIARRLIVSGRVQGVGFRYWTVTEARAAGLSGWVRNRTGGTVEAHVEGEASAVEALVRACRRGPAAARVDAVDVQETEPSGATGFEQRATG